MCLIFIADASSRPSLALADILQKSKVSCSAGKTYWRKLEMRASFTFSLGTACKLRLYRWPLPVLHRSQASSCIYTWPSVSSILTQTCWVGFLAWSQTCLITMDLLCNHWTVTVSGLLMSQTCFSTSSCFLVRSQLPPALALFSPSLAEQTALTVPWHCHTKPATTPHASKFSHMELLMCRTTLLTVHGKKNSISHMR